MRRVDWDALEARVNPTMRDLFAAAPEPAAAAEPSVEVPVEIQPAAPVPAPVIRTVRRVQRTGFGSFPR